MDDAAQHAAFSALVSISLLKHVQKRHSLSRCRQEARRFASERTPHARRACTYGPDCERAASCCASDCAREGVGCLLSKPLHMPARLFQALARAFRGCVRADRAGIPCVQGNALYGRVVQCSSGNGDAHTAGSGAVEGMSRRRAEYRLRCADKSRLVLESKRMLT